MLQTLLSFAWKSFDEENQRPESLNVDVFKRKKTRAFLRRKNKFSFLLG